MLVWDEKKREVNLIKHGLDFFAAYLVYDHPGKLTLRSARQGEERSVDIALVEVKGGYLTLIYVERRADIRIISFRNASRRERNLYAASRQD